jgi:acyl CoA:acetate/3-ketoacid CoA transferase beta subunit
MCVSIARSVEDGDVLMEGIGAMLPTAGYELARATHAPNAIGLSPVGGVFRTGVVPLSLDRYEPDTMSASRKRFTYGEIALWYLPAYVGRASTRWVEFVRPAQVDAQANTNNVVVGRRSAPEVRLPGAAGLPDVTALCLRVFMYVPRHDRRTFVERVDFISTAGRLHDFEADALPRVVTNLGVFAFRPEGGLVAESLHSGVTRDEVQAATCFAVEIPSSTPTTPSPSAEELRLLREEIDPLGLRRLELVSRPERYRLIRELLSAPGRLR